MTEARYDVWLNGETAGRGMTMEMAVLMVQAILEYREADTEMTVEIRREQHGNE